MGSQRIKRAAFFEKHPYCCFCGGTSAATEIDHIPARHLFRERQWPEGHEFPACSPCNRASSIDELALGWLLRLQISEFSAQDEKEMAQALDKLNRRRPEWVSAMKELSRNQTKRLLRDSGLTPSQFPGGESYAFEMPPEMASAAQRYGEKLGRALYYKVTGRLIPPQGGVRAQAMANTVWMSSRFPSEGFQMLSSIAPISRSGKDLSDQFAYRYGIGVDGHVAGFLVQFGESTCMFILAFEDEQEYLSVKARREHRLS